MRRSRSGGGAGNPWQWLPRLLKPPVKRVGILLWPVGGPALATLLLPLLAAPALALVEGSPHDLVAQGYHVTEESPQRERCRVCHLPTSSARRREELEVPRVLSQVYDVSSLVCFSCHDGTTIVSPSVDASRTAFHPASHGTDLEGYEDVTADATGLPDLEEGRMSCTTCHEPHDNGKRPFLRDSLQELCMRCHSRLGEYGEGGRSRSGNHVLAEDPLGNLRDDVPLAIGGAFRVGFPSPYPLGGGRLEGGWHWDLGGHLGQGGTGRLGCPTCHPVHGDEAAGPSAALLTVEPVNDLANLFCEGCHAGSRGDERPKPPHPNPGGTKTGRTYHAVDDDAANGQGRALEVREPPGWPFGGGSPRRLVCTTCHVAHGAQVETSLLRPPREATSFCEECHDQLPAFHHVTGAVGATDCGRQRSRTGDDVAGRLVCMDCHVAHNAGLGQEDESRYIPLLTLSAISGELCEKCHPAGNPTCNPDGEYQASHFLGDPTLADTYADPAPPLRTEKWPESGLTSQFGGAKDRAVTCLSCHSFRQGALISGDDGTARHLLARSGNPQEWEQGEEARYLCTGCHGVQPATAAKESGRTHPLMEADANVLGREPIPPLSTTPKRRVNCDSCHRPHNAATKGGRYVLERVSGENADPLAIHPTIDYTILCHGCHEKY